MATPLPQLNDGIYFMLVLDGKTYAAFTDMERIVKARKEQGDYGVRGLVDGLGVATIKTLQQHDDENPPKPEQL